MRSKAFLDMDGVIADFLGGVSKAHSRELPYNDPKSFGVFETEKLWGITSQEFWEPCDGEKFWEELEETGDANHIVAAVCETFGAENVAILTSPSMSSYCVSGKRRWIKKHFPVFSDRIIFGSAKEFLGGPNRVLIDDRSKNIHDFEAAGGIGITVPRAWNDWWDLRNVSDSVVRGKLKIYKEREL